MKSLRTIIVDDEELARSIIREYLEDHPEVVIEAECSNGFEAVKAITELKPDIVFLDVQMPKLNGFEVLELIETDLTEKMFTNPTQRMTEDYITGRFG